MAPFVTTLTVEDTAQHPYDLISKTFLFQIWKQCLQCSQRVHWVHLWSDMATTDSVTKEDTTQHEHGFISKTCFSNLKAMPAMHSGIAMTPPLDKKWGYRFSHVKFGLSLIDRYMVGEVILCSQVWIWLIGIMFRNTKVVITFVLFMRLPF